MTEQWGPVRNKNDEVKNQPREKSRRDEAARPSVIMIRSGGERRDNSWGTRKRDEIAGSSETDGAGQIECREPSFFRRAF